MNIRLMGELRWRSHGAVSTLGFNRRRVKRVTVSCPEPRHYRARTLPDAPNMEGARMTRCRSMLMACALAGLFGWLARGEAQTPTVSDLPKSNRCSTRAVKFETGGATMETRLLASSGGGWCWFDISAPFGSVRYVATYSVTHAPAHGEILMGEVNQKARIAYMPVSGFTGGDSFVLVNEITHSEMPVAVTVVR